MKRFDSKRRRIPPLLGAAIFVVAMVLAFTRPFEDDAPVQVSTGPTTSTTTPTSTTIVVVDGVPFNLPVPSLAPHVTTIAGPEGGVVNIHRRTTMEEICSNPELLRSLHESDRRQVLPLFTCPSTTMTTITRP